jgi:hypothetical protein
LANTLSRNSLESDIGVKPPEMSMVMAAVEEIVLEIVPQEDVLRLRVGQKIIALTELEDITLVKFSELARRYARRRKMRFVDVARN